MRQTPEADCSAISETPDILTEFLDETSGPPTELFPTAATIPAKHVQMETMTTDDTHEFGFDPSDAAIGKETCQLSSDEIPAPTLLRDPMRQFLSCDVPTSTQTSSSSTSKWQAPAPDVVPKFRGYFESQVFARCGLHALNNAIGASFLNAEDMTRACVDYLVEMSREGSVETRTDHHRPTGWYSEAVMSFVLRWKIARHELGSMAKLKMDVNNPVQPNEVSAARIYEANTLGVVVNHNQAHWITFKLEAGQIWLLDSMELPLPYSFREYVRYLCVYRNAFAIVDES